MPTNLDRFKNDLERLIKIGRLMRIDLFVRAMKEQGVSLSDKLPEDLIKEAEGSFDKYYQAWYTEACVVVERIIPHRLDEFRECYNGPKNRADLDLDTYAIKDYLRGITIQRPGSLKNENVLGVVYNLVKTQVKIVDSARVRFESRLFEIDQILQADLFDSELEAARELLRHGFLRAAGTLAGVVLERHLAHVVSRHQIRVHKRNPTINDLAQALKDADIIDVLTWRFIQNQADIRNICAHNRGQEPTREQVERLIDSVGTITKEVL